MWAFPLGIARIGISDRPYATLMFTLKQISYAFLLACVTSTSAQVTIPHTFLPNTPARASEVNANFQALKTSVDNLKTTIDALTMRVSKLEGPIAAADLNGTYRVHGIQTDLVPELTAGFDESVVESISYTGTATFSGGSPNGPGGTLALAIKGGKNLLRWRHVPDGAGVQRLALPSSAGGGLTVNGAPISRLFTTRSNETIDDASNQTWALNTTNGIITTSLGLTLSSASGGRILVGSLSREIDGSNVLLIFVRATP
jgi:hypothetical protein